MESPTVHAIVTAVSRRLAVTPIHVYEKTTRNGKDAKERLPNHPVANLLRKPNSWQSPYDFWQDATSTIMRWGRFYAFKSRGSTGPIRELLPLNPGQVSLDQDDVTWQVTARVELPGGRAREYPLSQLFHARGAARDFLTGNSPVEDVRTAIALEILAERFGANFFQNGALPLLVFGYADGSQGFESAEQEQQFLDDLQNAFGGDNMLKTMLLPKGIEKPTSVAMEHDKAQFLETRQYQRTVIAGAFGVPVHLTGDLSRATWNNVEQQDQDFTVNVVMPIVRSFEAAMERDLFTDADRSAGRIIRFNMDAILRADFKSRQEGLWLQRQAGVVNANEWREYEGMNPRDDEDGDDYLHPGNMIVDGEEPDDQQQTDDPFTDQAT
jgi:HK97 family phage portal protein